VAGTVPPGCFRISNVIPCVMNIVATVVDLVGRAAATVAEQIGGVSRHMDLSDRAVLDAPDETADSLVNTRSV
jgi:hypothetical protein